MNEAIFQFNDQAKPEFGLSLADPALSGKKAQNRPLVNAHGH